MKTSCPAGDGVPPAPESQQTRAKDLFLLSCVKAFLLKSKLCEEQPEQKGDREGFCGRRLQGEMGQTGAEGSAQLQATV